MGMKEKKQLSTSELSIATTNDDNAAEDPPTPSQPPLSAPKKDKTKSKWRDLFAFTRRQHSLALGLALAVSLAAGVVGPALSIFLGKLFNTFAEFASGKIDNAHFRAELSKDSLYLALIGLLSFTFGFGSFSAWMTFGELQARTCREEVFDGLLGKSIKWYDTRRSGVKALVARLNTYVECMSVIFGTQLT